MKKLLILMLLISTACSIPVDQPPLPTALPTASDQGAVISVPTFTFIPDVTESPVSTVPPAFCNDTRARELITSFTTALANKDGALLSSLVSPSRGMDVLFFRDGKTVNYDVEHAKFIFESTFQADWGLSFGSGESTLGSFQEIVLPSLQVIFTPSAELVCNQLKVGGATYLPEWPYPYMDYYSVHFAGTDPFGGLDWQTWTVGMDDVDGKLYLAALVHYVWEP